MKRRRKKHFRFSANREAILRFLSQTGIVSAETVVNLLLAVPHISAAMLTDSKSDSLHNLDALSASFVGVNFRSRKAIYNFLERLDRDGLIEKRAGCLKIVKRGLAYLSRYISLPRWGKKYITKKSRSLTLVVFDIPEKQRTTRDWLRDALRKMRFVPLQQSVWIGKVGIPFDFLHDIENYGIQEYIHILKVHKQGSLSAVINKLLIKH